MGSRRGRSRSEGAELEEEYKKGCRDVSVEGVEGLLYSTGGVGGGGEAVQ